MGSIQDSLDELNDFCGGRAVISHLPIIRSRRQERADSSHSRPDNE